MGCRNLFVVLALLILFVAAAPACAAGTVILCDEASLLAALAGGGTVTFSCSGTIVLTNPTPIGVDRIIDGSGHEVTISGNNAVQVVYVGATVALALKSLTIADGDLDLVLHFRLGDPDLTCDSTEAVLLGRTFDGRDTSQARTS